MVIFMPISKVQVPSLTTPIDIRNGHSANVTYENEQFSAQVTTVNNPYVGLILSLYFPATLDIESGVKQVSLTFGNSETYTTSFLIIGYSYEYVVPVLIQIKSINNGALTYDILHKGSVPSSSTSIEVGIDSEDDTQLNFDAGSNAQSTIVITYPNEDIEGTSYEVYAGGGSGLPAYIPEEVSAVLTLQALKQADSITVKKSQPVRESGMSYAMSPAGSLGVDSLVAIGFFEKDADPDTAEPVLSLTFTNAVGTLNKLLSTIYYTDDENMLSDCNWDYVSNTLFIKFRNINDSGLSLSGTYDVYIGYTEYQNIEPVWKLPKGGISPK